MKHKAIIGSKLFLFFVDSNKKILWNGWAGFFDSHVFVVIPTNDFLFFSFQVHFLEEKVCVQCSVDEELRNVLKEKRKLIEEKSREVKWNRKTKCSKDTTARNYNVYSLIKHNSKLTQPEPKNFKDSYFEEFTPFQKICISLYSVAKLKLFVSAQFQWLQNSNYQIK